MLGTYALSAGYYDAYYLRAQKVRALIARDFSDAFQKVDVIVTPTAPTPAFRLGEKTSDPLQMYLADIYTVTGSLAGVPGISVPCGRTERAFRSGCKSSDRISARVESCKSRTPSRKPAALTLAMTTTFQDFFCGTSRLPAGSDAGHLRENCRNFPRMNLLLPLLDAEICSDSTRQMVFGDFSSQMTDGRDFPDGDSPNSFPLIGTERLLQGNARRLVLS